MVQKRLSKGALLLAALVVAGQASAQEKQTRRLAGAGFAELHRFLEPQPGESRWMEIDWHPTVWEARQKAAAEGKPLFIWAGSGGAPAAGC
jgi:hypothetical protein